METGSTLPAAGNYPGGVRQQFCVSWNSHQSNMHSAFPKLLSSEQFVDVTLACDGGSIKCHKVVLSACSDYLERLLLDIPCTHPIIFLRDMRMWELQALVEFMYRGEVYVEQQQLEKLMQAADALQVRGLSSQGRDTIQSENVSQQNSSSAPTSPPLSSKPASSNYKLEETASLNASNSSFIDDTTSAVSPEALQHLEKALSACEATLTETQGMVKMEPDEQFTQDIKPYSISMVQPGSMCSPSSPFPAIEGYQRRQRRSEHELKQASDLVARGMTFQVASEKYKIPISTIRFYMARKGILQRRKRGRGTSQHGVNSQPGSPASPPYHMMNYRLPESLNSSLQ
ncbi:modifier of mdg4 isoform X2 [Venturia canescens]|uniref:modifier of mdg4 isoform X2 n=1 Tax=Venturia canescens TaxID=32260 RepID=UPI001C9D6410|nr:modifier of mdg4 isoform X2 [Venturia canescens]